MRLNECTNTPNFEGIYKLKFTNNVAREKVYKMLDSMSENSAGFIYQHPKIKSDMYIKFPDKQGDRKFATFVVDNSNAFSFQYYDSDEGLRALKTAEDMAAYTKKNEEVAYKGIKALKEHFKITDFKARIKKQKQRDAEQIPGILKTLNFNATHEMQKANSGVVMVHDSFNRLYISPENQNGFRYICKSPIQSMTDAKSVYYKVTREQKVMEVPDAIEFSKGFNEGKKHYHDVTKPVTGE